MFPYSLMAFLILTTEAKSLVSAGQAYFADNKVFIFARSCEKNWRDWANTSLPFLLPHCTLFLSGRMNPSSAGWALTVNGFNSANWN